MFWGTAFLVVAKGFYPHFDTEKPHPNTKVWHVDYIKVRAFFSNGTPYCHTVELCFCAARMCGVASGV